MNLLPPLAGRPAPGARPGEGSRSRDGAHAGARAAAYSVRRARPTGWRWRLARRGVDVAVAPRAVPGADQALRAIFRVRLTAATAPAETFTDDRGCYRWRLLTRSGGSILAVSAAAYDSSPAAERAIAAFRRVASHAELED